MTWRRPHQGGLTAAQLVQLSSAHAPARLSPTAVIANAIAAAPLTVDGVAVNVGDRILRTLDGANNGLWVVVTPGAGANGVWERAPDYNTNALVENTVILFVQEGAVNANSYWSLDTNPPITLGVTALVYTKLLFGSGGGGKTPLMWGARSLARSTTTRFLYPAYSDRLAQTTPIEMEVGEAGVISMLRILHNVPGGNAALVTYTLFKNGVATALSVTAAANSTGGADLVNSVAVVVGDQLSIRVTKAASTGSAIRDVTATAKYA